MKRSIVTVLMMALLPVLPVHAGNNGNSPCSELPSHSDLRAALQAANIKPVAAFDLQNEMWGTIVAADGTVCAVAHTGPDNLQSQWLLSRVISAQKANTANALSLGNGLALSTANLMAAVQPGGSLYGLQHSNPVNTSVAYRGNSRRYGTRNDPMVGRKIGGVNIFGGGLALYDHTGKRVGGVGVSGDTSCRDHFVGWETRHELGLDYVPPNAGVAAIFNGDLEHPDNIIFDSDNNLDGFEHAGRCLNQPNNPLDLTPVPVS